MSNALSQAALETLSIIAYKQPISRIEIDEIRGVQTSGSIQKLVARQLIEEKYRVDGPGRAILYGTTKYFMDYFGLKSLDELPDIQQMEDELEEELPMDLFLIVIKKRTQCLKQQKARKLKQWKDYKKQLLMLGDFASQSRGINCQNRVKVNTKWSKN